MTIIPFPVKATEAEAILVRLVVPSLPKKSPREIEADEMRLEVESEAVKNTCLSLTTYNHQDAVPRHRGFFRVFCSHCKMFICYRPTEGVNEGEYDISHGSHKECSQLWLAAQMGTIEKLQLIAA